VRPIEKAHSDDVHVFVDSHLRYLFWCCEEAGVDYFHSCVSEGAAENEGASVMPIQPRLGNKDPDSLVRARRWFLLEQIANLRCIQSYLNN